VWVPPHIPWVLIVIGLAFFRAFNHMREYRTLLSLRGPCPKCGTVQDYTELGRMGNPHKVTCSNCRWDLFVEVPRASEAT
jgi:transcription elongation factor Elf1